MHFAALASKEESKNKKCTAYVYENRMKNIKTIQALVRRLANEQSLYARAALELFKGAVCWRLFSLSPLSPLPSFSFISLLSLPHSSLRFVFKTGLGKRTPGKP